MNKIKKLILSLLMTATILSPIQAFALDAPEDEVEKQGSQNEPQTLYHDYLSIGLNDEYPVTNTGQKPNYIVSRRAYVTDSAWTNYGIERYYQDDYPNPICSGGGSLAQYGCTVTSFSMVLAKYGVYSNPTSTFNSLLATGGIFANCNMTWNASAVSRAFSGITMEHWINTGFKESTGMQTIEGILKTGKPVIVGMKELSTGNTHYVVCYGYEKYSDGGSFHYTFNPQRGRSETIEGYMAGWYIMDFTTLYR